MRVWRWWQRVNRLGMSAGNERLDDADDHHQNDLADYELPYDELGSCVSEKL
jgi:hypothetical protein